MATVTIPLGASIQAAIDANPAGTVFQLAAGTYYGEQFQFKSNDQLIGDPSGNTILSGALLLNNWTQSGNYWVDSGLPSAVGKSAPGNPLAPDLNDLFVNNTLYTRVSSLAQVTSGTWYFDSSTGSAIISDNPGGKTVEYSNTPIMTWNNGATGVVIQNLTTEKYATDAQAGPISAGTNWQINNVTSTQNHGAGLLITAGDIVQGGHYDNNGQIGIEGSGANGAQVLNAEIAYNNYAGYGFEWDAGGIKAGGTSNFTISGDNIHDNNGNGIWSDVDSANWTISNNTISNNTYDGVLTELSHGPISVTNNTIANNSGSGIYVSNSSNITVTGNTVTVNPNNVFNGVAAATGGGIDVINNSGRGSDASGNPYLAINDTVENNTIIHPGDNTQDGIIAYQPLPSNANDIFNGNTYDVSNANGTYWFFNSNSYTWSSLRQNTPYEQSGTENVGQGSTTSSSSAPATVGSAAAPTPTPTPAATPTPTSSSASIVIPADEANTTVSQNQVSVAATAGDHMVLISGTGDTFSLSGGTETITDNGGGNTFVMPTSGNGVDTFTNNILTNGDTLDLRSALAATDWNGAAGTLSKYLHVAVSGQAETLSISSTSGGSRTAIATVDGVTTRSLSTLLGHALT